MSDRFEEIHFPLFYGAQNRRSEPSRFLFSFLGSSSLRIGARFRTTFWWLKIGIVLYVQTFMSDIWNKKREAWSWKRYRLIEAGAPTLGYLTKLTMTHEQYHLLIGGSCDCLLFQQGACGPEAISCGWIWALSRNSFFVKPHKRTIIRHELRCSELKG